LDGGKALPPRTLLIAFGAAVFLDVQLRDALYGWR
jgi:hypothetical protein